MPPRMRLRRSLSLRALMLVVLLVGGTLGWLAYEARVQREAVATIKKAGGFVLYDWEAKLGEGPAGKPPGPRWLVDWIGIDYFATIDRVDLRSWDVDVDSVWRAVDRLGKIRGLSLSFPYCCNGNLAHVTQLTSLRELIVVASEERDLANLRDLVHLEQLVIAGGGITDAGLAHLRGLVRLKYLKVGGPGITDAGLANVVGMTRLQSLWLEDTSVEGSGLTHLAAMDDLRVLSLSGPRLHRIGPIGRKDVLERLILVSPGVTDTTLDALSNFPKLRVLELYDGTGVGDAGITRLRGRSGIFFLELHCAEITDVALADLATLTGCDIINLDTPKVTAAGLARLRAALPRTTIWNSGGL